jgi:plasmid stabilization system protein ParE
MKVEYTNRASSDLRRILRNSRRKFGIRVAAALEARIKSVVERIGRDPFTSPEVQQKPGVHVVLLLRYPFKIFYRVLDDRVRILHIRHTAQQTWQGNE